MTLLVINRFATLACRERSPDVQVDVLVNETG
jgi:hypothetical protein